MHFVPAEDADWKALLRDALAGTVTILTVEGRPAARLSPVSENRDVSLAEIRERIRAIRKCARAGPESASDLIAEGRR